MKQRQPQASSNLLFALAAGLAGKDWRELTEQEQERFATRTRIPRRLDRQLVPAALAGDTLCLKKAVSSGRISFERVRLARIFLTAHKDRRAALLCGVSVLLAKDNLAKSEGGSPAGTECSERRLFASSWQAGSGPFE